MNTNGIERSSTVWSAEMREVLIARGFDPRRIRVDHALKGLDVYHVKEKGIRV